MLGSIARKLFGSKNERDLKKLEPLVQAVNELEPNFKTLTDEAIRAKTEEFKDRISKRGNRGRTPARSLRSGPRGLCKDARDEAL